MHEYGLALLYADGTISALKALAMQLLSVSQFILFFHIDILNINNVFK